MIFLAALAPVLLHINPILGSLIGVVATLIFVAVAVAVIVRLRANSERDDKEFGGGNPPSSPSVRCAAGSTEVELLDKGSAESLEEKNPDIVPLQMGEKYYGDNNPSLVFMGSGVKSEVFLKAVSEDKEVNPFVIVSFVYRRTTKSPTLSCL